MGTRDITSGPVGVAPSAVAVPGVVHVRTTTEPEGESR
ncbi:hypothetical protein J2S66_000204 [Saccharothrix longispora]|uniref:Uncharacterized protein n=1 Tax=Saccharothrix longispora TaxID=33920 RepID=A0ABU1PMD2_9PSEU|nr:hypothetical protein [Saccharothrix longispora]